MASDLPLTLREEDFLKERVELLRPVIEPTAGKPDATLEHLPAPPNDAGTEEVDRWVSKLQKATGRSVRAVTAGSDGFLEAEFESVKPAEETSDPLARLVALDRERRTLEDRLEAIIKERAPLEEILLEQWADRNQRNATVDGMTVYISRDFFCTKRKEASTEQLLEVLQAHGLERVIQAGYNASGLKAWVKEQLAAGSDIPEALAALLNYDTVSRLKTRLA